MKIDTPRRKIPPTVIPVARAAMFSLEFFTMASVIIRQWILHVYVVLHIYVVTTGGFNFNKLKEKKKGF